jgi:flagellar hook-associated protein 1 FlgK
MRSTFSGLEVSKRSLFAQQTALQTTAHNMANANTKGYTRQAVDLVASRPMEAVGMTRSNAPGQIGTGVEYDSIYRIRERFLDHQFYNENKNFGQWTVRKDTLDKLEAIVNEPSDTGIRQVIENFWNAWQVLSKEPENLTARAALKEGALALTDAFNHTSRQLQDLSNDMTENIIVKVNQSNSLLSQIANLNNEIFRIEGLGNHANDLRDQRDVLVDELSKIINVSVTEESRGYSIRMGNTQLISGPSVGTALSAQSLSDAFASGDLTSGETYGLIVSRDQYIASYRFQVDSMVRSLVEGDVSVTLSKGTVVPDGTTIGGKEYTGSIAERTLTEDTKVVVKGINGLHRLGYTMGQPMQSGIPFFTLKEGYSEFGGESITVNPDIISSVSNIAASARVYDAGGTERVVRGNNEIALAVAGVRNKKFEFDSSEGVLPLLANGTFDEFFRTMVGQLGVQSQEAGRQAVNQKILVDQIESKRQSVSGVSLDEEMANMVKYQHAYNAAARVMTTFDEMLDRVINGMGIVGR